MKSMRFKRYICFGSFAQMQEYIRRKYENKPQPNIIGHGYNAEYKHYFEVEE